MSWSYASATNLGAVHAPDEACQDYALVRQVTARAGDCVLLAAVADGAGTSKAGAIGAQLAANTFCDQAQALLERGRNCQLADGDIRRIFGAVVQSIQDRAAEDGAPLEEYSTTLVAAAVFEGSAVVIQVGDGAAVCRASMQFEVALWPEKAEFVNTTYFVTRPDVAKHVFVKRIQKRVQDLALFTDGLQYMLLDFRAEVAHQPFFQSVSEKLEAAEDGSSPPMEDWLLSVLRSAQVTERSDDDTGIVVARRRQPLP